MARWRDSWLPNAWLKWLRPVVTVLPTTAETGDEVLLSASTSNNSILWPLRYDAAVAGNYKWVPVGSVVPLTSEVEVGGTSGTTTSGIYVTSLTGGTTTGPNVTVPAAGIYDVQLEFMWQNTVVSAFTLMAYLRPDGTGSDDKSGPREQTMVANLWTVSKGRRRTTTTVAGTFQAMYRVTGGTGSYLDRIMTIWPVLLG